MAMNYKKINCTLVGLNFLIWILCLPINTLAYQDFLGQWKLCAYTLRGTDPYPLVGVETPAIEELGIIPTGWGTTPWGLLLGNLFYPAFLDWKAAAFIPSTATSILEDLQAYRELNSALEPAEIYFVVINVLLLLATAIIVFKYFKPISKDMALTSCLISIFSFAQLIPLKNTGNASSIVCCLMILICLLHEKYPKLSGILLAFAMVKPQLALIFCLPLLLMRRFKMVVIAALIDISAWLIVSIMTSTSPTTLLTEFLSADIGGSKNYAGIFTLFTASNYNLAMLLSMLAGIIYVIVCHKLLSDCKICAFKFFPACIAATFWCYSFSNEFYILILPAIVCIYLIVKSRDFVVPFGAALFMTVGIFILMLWFEAFNEVLGNFDWNALLALDNVQEYVILWIMRTIFEGVTILIGLYLCRRLKNVSFVG